MVWIACIALALLGFGGEVFGQVPAGVRGLKGATEVQGYRIEFEGIGVLDGSAGVMKLRPDFVKGMVGGNGVGVAGRVAGGGGLGGGVGLPNQGIAMRVTDLEEGKRQEKEYLVEFGGQYEIVEFNGMVSESKGEGPMVRSWPSFEKEFPGCSVLYVDRRRGVDVDFRELSGELRVTPGRRLVAEFEVGGKKPAQKNAAQKNAAQKKPAQKNAAQKNAVRKNPLQKKRVAGQEFVLESIEVNGDGVLVTVGFPEWKKVAEWNDPVALMQMLSQGGNELEIEDSEGEVMSPIGSSSGTMRSGLGDGSSGGFGGVASGGFSFSGGSGGGFSFQSDFQGQGGLQGQGVAGMEGLGSKMTFRFGPLPEGRQIALVRAIKVERTGEAQVVPFKLSPQ
jgi:hypothetical protein